MIFKKLVLKNIRSYEDVEITFPKGSILLAGEIGAGKTSILLGIQFALFGLQPGQKGASILRTGNDTAYAGLEIEIEGETITLERTIKKSKNGSITQDSNIITTSAGSEEISTSEMKDRVMRLLNYPKEFAKKSNLLYKFTVYTPQEEMKSIIEERPEVRLDTLRHIFGIDRYKRIKDNAAILVQNVKEQIKIKEVLVGELNLLKEKFVIENEKKIILARDSNTLTIDSTKLLTKKETLDQKKAEVSEIIEENKKISVAIDNSNIRLQAKKDTEDRMKKEIMILQKQTNQEIDFSEERLSSIKELYEKHKQLVEESTKKMLNVHSVISVLESKKERPLKLKEKVISLENCPTCFQTVGNEHKEKISKRSNFEIEDINRELEQKILEKNNLIKILEKEKELVRGYELDKNTLEQNKIKFEHQNTLQTKIKSDAFILDRVRNEKISIEKELDDLKNQMGNFKESEEIYQRINLEENDLNEEIRKNQIELATKNKELELVKSRLEELRQEISSKERLRKEINYLRELQDWIQEKFITLINVTEKNVMAKLRVEFSSIFCEWFAVLVPDALSVRLNEDFTPIISNQDYEIEYDFLSGGERTAVALAYRLSLNQVLNSMLSKIKTKDIVILDEPTDGFAIEQIEKMRDIFDQLNAEQMIIVSHEEKIEGFVDHIRKVEKMDTSRIENPE